MRRRGGRRGDEESSEDDDDEDDDERVVAAPLNARERRLVEEEEDFSVDNSEEETSSDDDDDDDDDSEETDSDDESDSDSESETESETGDDMDVDEVEVEVTVESLATAVHALTRSRGPWEPVCVRAMRSIGINYEQGSLAQVEALIALLYEKRNGVELSFELCVALLVYETATTDFQQELGGETMEGDYGALALALMSRDNPRGVSGHYFARARSLAVILQRHLGDEGLVALTQQNVPHEELIQAVVEMPDEVLMDFVDNLVYDITLREMEEQYNGDDGDGISSDADDEALDAQEDMQVKKWNFHELLVKEGSSRLLTDDKGPFVTYREDACQRVCSATNHHQGADAICAFPTLFSQLASGHSFGLTSKPRDAVTNRLMYFVVDRDCVSLFSGLLHHPLGMFKLHNYHREEDDMDPRVRFDYYSVYSIDCTRSVDQKSMLFAMCGADRLENVLDNVIICRVAPGENMQVVRDDVFANPVPEWNFQELAAGNVGLPYGFVDNEESRRLNNGYFERARSPFLAEQPNCIRFAHIDIDGRKELRIVLSSNDSHVYILRLDEDKDEIKLVGESKHNFGSAVNCAEVSPCGTMLAAATDSRTIQIMKAVGSANRSDFTNFCTCTFEGWTRFDTPMRRQYSLVNTGSSQYLAWSPDGRYLAATSDSESAVMIWLTKRFRAGEVALAPMAVLDDHIYPCLPVTFAPGSPSIMVWAERSERVHVLDVRELETIHETLREACVELKYTSLDEASCVSASMRTRELYHSRDGFDIRFFSRMVPYYKTLRRVLKKDGSLTSNERAAFLDECRRDRTSGQCLNIQTLRQNFDATTITGISVTRGVDPSLSTLQKSELHWAQEPYADSIIVTTSGGVFVYSLEVGLHGAFSNFKKFPKTFQRAALAFLLCAKASKNGRSNGSACLGDLPQDILKMILSKAALPIFVWADMLGNA
jgi:hypothetical protein